MSKFTHTVIAEMVDKQTGERKFPGEGFTPHDEKQEKRLRDAGCIEEGAPKAPERAPAAEAVTVEELTKLGKTKLVALAKAESITLAAEANDAPKMAAAIFAAREAKAAEAAKA